MTEKELPDWTTEMDKEILEMLTIEWELTPAVIADNIGRSREGVSRRLNTLDAGGLVEKTGRGKYRITSEALEKVDKRWTMIELSEEESRAAALKDYLQQEKIKEELGITMEQYQKEVEEEYRKLLSGAEESDADLFEKAARIVEDRHSSETTE